MGSLHRRSPIDCGKSMHDVFTMTVVVAEDRRSATQVEQHVLRLETNRIGIFRPMTTVCSDSKMIWGRQEIDDSNTKKRRGTSRMVREWCDVWYGRKVVYGSAAGMMKKDGSIFNLHIYMEQVHKCKIRNLNKMHAWSDSWTNHKWLMENATNINAR
ncbi:hypothetical protein MLD38_005090 [Melastoma candidum]|uniref:Uncharacterized protein n=1 Tax=Melastoma candidum TaxID=119954 RepID=A0ACB9S8L2_9MYRT|nr:hypothetical protein MLD38_005090 [Melastoma candidum]